jgi:hypothetical protein
MQNVILFYVGSHILTIFWFYDKIVKLCMVDVSRRLMLMLMLMFFVVNS